MVSLLQWLRSSTESALLAQDNQTSHDTSLGYADRGGKVAAVLRRLQALAGYATNAQQSVLAAFAEIESRTQLVDAQAQRLQTLSQSLQDDASTRREDARTELDQLSAQTGAHLGDMSGRLDDKVQRIGQVIEMIDRTSRELELLALNAKIQAAHAGEQGRAFAVVADNMRQLAHSSMQNLASVRNLLDFSELQGQFGAFQSDLTGRIQTVTRGISNTLQSLTEGQQAMRAATQSIETANRTIPDMLATSRDALRRQSGTLDPLTSVAAQLGQAAHTGLADFDVAADAMGLVPDDLLQRILQRGCLRVAVEPAFWGLSFRLQRDEALCGLDVDYARAFAQYLGVELELVEQPWVECPPLLQSGRTAQELPVDLMWSALVPSAAYHGLVYSEPYMHLNFVLVRRARDAALSGLPALQGRVLGCLNDPAVFDILEQAGVRWSKHPAQDKGIRLGNLIAYANLSDIFDALADGRIDAAPIDGPLAGWTCRGEGSAWRGKLEPLPGTLNQSPWHYAVGVRDDASSLPLLQTLNAFLAEFRAGPQRAELHARWYYPVVPGNGTYRDEPGRLRGEPEIAAQCQ